MPVTGGPLSIKAVFQEACPLLTIPRNIHDAMLRHGLEQKPNECCGFLAADKARFVKLLVAADNIDKSTMTFRIGPVFLDLSPNGADNYAIMAILED